MTDARTALLARLKIEIVGLPFAYLTAEDADFMVARLATDPTLVYGKLIHDAEVHEECWNQLKADHIRQTAARVLALTL